MAVKKVIIIGGGAAGFFAAINCAIKNSNYQITILEKSSKLLSKVKVSGGGRCNVTNACFDNQQLVKNYPRGEKELQNVFSRFNAQSTVEWFKQQGVELKTEPDGRMFPATNNSETIVNCLIKASGLYRINVLQNEQAEEIIRDDNGTFTVLTNHHQLTADAIVVATGGNAKPEAYEWLKKLGHSIKPPVPSLFTFNLPQDNITSLMGISVADVRVKIPSIKLETTGPILITHWGLSGPAVLKASAWGATLLNKLNYHFSVFINWLPKYNEEKLKIEFNNFKTQQGAKTVVNTPYFDLPKRLWEHFVIKSGIAENTRWADLSKKQLNVLTNTLINNEFQVKGKTTFKEEFVTCGGVSLKEIDLTTMQSKIVPNLYFAGEVIDVDGITGGFNFQNAWSTAWIAANNI